MLNNNSRSNNDAQQTSGSFFMIMKRRYNWRYAVIKRVQLLLRDRASTLSVQIWYNATLFGPENLHF